jgi:hypothetical protein
MEGKQVMLVRSDIERIVENVISELSLEVSNGDFYSSNSKKIILRLGERIITEAWIDVTNQPSNDI